jgi:uncharacterized membrane protein
MNLVNNRLSLIAIVFLLPALVASDAAAGHVPVFGGPSYDPATDTGYRFSVIFSPVPGAPFSPSLVNNNGVAIGTSDKFQTGINQGRRTFKWSGSGAPFEEMNIPARFAGESNTAWAYAINDSGIAIGAVYNDEYGERPVRWDSSGGVIELQPLETRFNDDFTWGQPYAINNAGVIAGYSQAWDGGFNIDRAVRWSADGTVTELGSISTSINPNRPPRSRAYAMNEGGTAVGYAQFLGGGFSDGGTRAVRWDGSGTAATELGHLGLAGSRTQSEAYDVNESGAAVGFANKDGGIPGLARAVRWDANTTAATELGTLGGSGPSRAYAINDGGTAVGVIDAGAAARAVRWDASAVAATPLGHLGTDGTTRAYDINNSGIAVGDAQAFVNGVNVGGHAVAWLSDTTAIDLNDLIDPTSGWLLTSAFSISDTNWITGIGSFDPDGPGGTTAYNRVFLLQLPPVPEPATAVLGLLAVASKISIRRMRVMRSGRG